MTLYRRFPCSATDVDEATGTFCQGLLRPYKNVFSVWPKRPVDDLPRQIMSHELEPIRQLADALRNAPVSWLATTDRIADLSTMERDGFLFDQEFMESFLFSLVKRFGADEVANGLEFFADKEEFY